MKKKDKIEDSGVYVIFVTTLMIFYQSIKSYTFPMFGTRFSYSLFLLPFTFYIIQFINKKFDYKKAVAAIAISAVTFVCFTSIISYILREQLYLTSLSGDFCGYVGSQFLCLLLAVKDKKPSFSKTFGYTMFSLFVYQLFQTMILLDTMTFPFFMITIFTTLFFQAIICLLLGILDRKER